LREGSPRPLTLTLIVPATNGPPTLSACLASIRAAEVPPEQIIVVEDPSITHPAVARNVGARDAVGDVLIFVDADVTVAPDAFVGIRRVFESDPGLAALFGSYDDEPGARDVVSVFRNLLHHHVHQNGGGPAGTFWAGLGAIRRDVFEAHGGFSVHPIEDIELGMRLARDGERILLEPSIQGKHLKRWSLPNMIRTDLFVRGIPWVGLLIEYRDSASTTALNLGWAHRLTALSFVVAVAAVLLGQPLITLGAIVLAVILNLSFYRLLVRKEGLLRAAAGVGLHGVHHLVSAAAVPLGLWVHFRRRREGARVEAP